MDPLRPVPGPLVRNAIVEPGEIWTRKKERRGGRRDEEKGATRMKEQQRVKQGRIHGHKSLQVGRKAKASRIDQRTDQRTDGRTHAHIESLRRD